MVRRSTRKIEYNQATFTVNIQTSADDAQYRMTDIE
jgi:hypothetical protein